ncbi:hypothetical protein EV174_001498 [Coemansia sp. RSA 2320]|nr:hypothetical protein EV174_001498 [Coemansia sp. RSA 2320]
MNLQNQAQTAASERIWLVTVPLRPGACTVIDWTLCAVTEDGPGAEEDSSKNDGDTRQKAQSDAESGSESSDDEGDVGGYASGTAALPPAIASDPFFARLLRNAEMHEANEKKSAKRRVAKRRAKDAAEEDYDFNDPFIDDSELTFMNGHNHTNANQRKKRRKKDDGCATDAEGQSALAAPGAFAASDEGDTPGAVVKESDAALDDVDRYDADDFFVYYGPLNESVDSADEDSFEAPAKKTRARKRPEKKQPAKEVGAQTKKKANGAAGQRGGDSSDATATKKKPEVKAQHRRSGSENAANAALIPSNGRKSGARTSRKLDQTKSSSVGEGVGGTADTTKQRRPPVPDRDKPMAATSSVASGSVQTCAGTSPPSTAAQAAGALADTAAKGGEADTRAASKRGGTPTVGGPPPPSEQETEIAKAESEARSTTAEMEAAMAELEQAVRSHAFANRQRFPTALKPPLRLVCELCMVRALEYDRQILSPDTPEQSVLAWSTSLDTVGFVTGIYDRVADIMPYNRLTVRKIVGKLLGYDLITWKERQLKQIEDGLKLRIDQQIKNGSGWIPVAARAPSKEGLEEGAVAAVPGGGSQVRWHWSTLSKHILFQYMLLTLDINELRNQLDPSGSKDGAYREQQARKSAYAHLVSLWPGSSMSTYEVSRAYSSRKSLLDKHSRRSDGGPGLAKQESGAQGTTDAAAPETHLARATPAAHIAERGEHTSENVSARQQQQQQQASMSPRPVGEYVREQNVHGNFSPPATGQLEEQMTLGQKLPSPSQMLENGPAAARFASPLMSHRNLHFGQVGVPVSSHPPLQRDIELSGQLTALDQHVRSRTSAIFGAVPPKPQHELPAQNHPPLPGNNSDAGYSSPGSSRYSMSVHNLTSP